MYVRTLPSDSPKVVVPWPVALHGSGHRHARRWLRRRPHLRRRLHGTRPASDWRRPGRNARPDQLLQAWPAAGGNPQPGPPLRHWLGRVADRPLPPPLRLRGLQRRRARAAIVFDGVFDQVGGAGRGSFNHRFGQQSRDQLQHFNIQYPVDMFPFTDEEQTDPVTGPGTACSRERGAAAPSRSSSTCSPTPRYFNRAGSLVHTDVSGTRDVEPPATSRIYQIASAPHIVGPFPPAPSRTRTSWVRPT